MWWKNLFPHHIFVRISSWLISNECLRNLLLGPWKNSKFWCRSCSFSECVPPMKVTFFTSHPLVCSVLTSTDLMDTFWSSGVKPSNSTVRCTRHILTYPDVSWLIMTYGYTLLSDSSTHDWNELYLPRLHVFLDFRSSLQWVWWKKKVEESLPGLRRDRKKAKRRFL